MVPRPRTHYARNGDVHIAYQVFGEGPIDLVLVPAWLNQVEHVWTLPSCAGWLERFASFARVITFDRRGTGLSDPMVEPLALEEQIDDIVAVMDAAGSEQAALFAQSEGTAMACLYAATRPDRVRALAVYSPIPSFAPAPGYDWPLTPDDRAERLAEGMGHWGEGSSLGTIAPRSAAADPELRRWFGELERLSVPPGMLPIIHSMVAATDVRAVLPSIRTPTLVLHRPDDKQIDDRHAEYAAQHIPCARLVAVPGDESLAFTAGIDVLMDEIEEFLTGTRPAPEPDRVLSTVLFTDLVGSTQRAAAIGDGPWRDLLARHDRLVRVEVARHRGHAVKSLGDGWLATFDGPARAVRCALALRPAVAALGLELRAGLHTGEVELLDGDVGGLAVHIGARVAALASSGQILVSRTVRDLVVGSGLEFDAGETHELRGVPGSWDVHAVIG